MGRLRRFHQRTLPPDMRVRRLLRSVGYAALGSAGALIADQIPFSVLPWYNVMGGFLAVGGAASFIGAATGRWAGEFIGLPLLISAMWAFAALTWRDQDEEGLMNVLLLFAYGVFMLARWVDVKAVGRIAKGDFGGR